MIPGSDNAEMQTNSGDGTANEPQCTIMEQSVAESALKEIHRLHEEVSQTARLSLCKAVELGEHLCALKQLCKHGEWIKFVAEKLPFGAKTATNYIRLARSKHLLKPETISDLNVTNAYKLLKAKTDRSNRSVIPDIESLEPVTFADGTLITWPENEGPLFSNIHIAQEFADSAKRKSFRSIPSKQEQKRAQELVLILIKWTVSNVKLIPSNSDQKVYRYVFETCKRLLDGPKFEKKTPPHSSDMRD